MDRHTSFSNLHIPSSFLTQAPGSSWASTVRPTAHSRGQPTAQPFTPFSDAAHSGQFLKQAHQASQRFGASPSSHGGPQVSNIWATPLHRESTANLGFPPWMPLSQGPFLPPSGWLTNCWFQKWPLYTEGKERLKKEADHFRWASGRFNKQGNLHTGLVLGGPKMSRSPHSSTRILYRDLNWVQSCIPSR